MELSKLHSLILHPLFHSIKSLKMDQSSKLQRVENGFLSSKLGEETVMMNLNNGDYLGLNSVASDIWDLLEQPIMLSDLNAKILSMYHVNKEQCEAEVNSFLEKLMDNKMLIVQ